MITTHASLFSGIGGFDLAAEWVGWENMFNCEVNDFCRKVLAYHFPKAQQYGDISATDFTVWRDRIDVLSGGFPCQPFSTAGKRQGTADDRYLWPEMLRAIGEIRPRWVVGENVLGFVSWSGGMVLQRACHDMEAIGYEVGVYVIPAYAVGAPHLRNRVWIVAHTDSNRRRDGEDQQKSVPECLGAAHAGDVGEDGPTDNSERFSRFAGGFLVPFPAKGTTERESGTADSAVCGWKGFPAESPICGRDDGLSEQLDGITVPAWRRESIKAYGNAVVPQLVKVIFETIKEYDIRRSH